ASELRKVKLPEPGDATPQPEADAGHQLALSATRAAPSAAAGSAAHESSLCSHFPTPVNLDDIRIQIDKVDRQLLDLLSERADLVHEVGVVKKRDGLQIYAPEREESLLRKLVEMNKGRLPEKSIRAIYR